MAVDSTRMPRAPLARVLLVEPDDEVREVLGAALSGMGLAADAVGTLAAARALLTQRAYRLCLTDSHLEDGDALTLVRHLREHWPGVAVVVLTARASLEGAVAALRAGASDCLAKPVSIEELRTLVSHTLDLPMPTSPSAPPPAPGELVGGDAAIVALREAVARVAALRAPVAIHGEAGSGKTLLARLIHAASTRWDRAFVVVDCAAVGAAELFGRGAEPDAEGLVHAAHGGTLFLSEVEALSPTLQLRLSRMLADQRLRRMGATFDESVDVRVITSSVHPLARGLEAGRVLPRLYYALDLVEMHMPSLRDRRSDIPLLTAHILARLEDDYGVPQVRCADDAMECLMAYAFPGNVRELNWLLERALARSGADRLNCADLNLPPSRDD